MPESREEEVTRLQARLAELTNETVAEVDEALQEAEEEVTPVAEQVTEELQDAHETIHEGEREVEDAVHETAQETAEELGQPELADAIAEHLYSRLHRDGLLPHTQHHSVEVATEAETVPIEHETAVQEAPVESPPQGPDTPPEPQHWWYRPRSIGFRKR